MKLAFTTRFGHDEELIFAQQLGADAVVVRFALGDPTDTNLAPVAHRVRVAGLQLAGVELTGMPQEFEPWANGLTGALLAAESAGVDTLLCASPTQKAASLATDLESVVATASAAGVTVLLDSARLLKEEMGLLPAGNVRVELAVDADTSAEEIGDRVRSGGIEALRFEGQGQPLGEAPVDVPALLSAANEAGFSGLLRGGAPAALTEDDDWHPKGAANDLGYLRAVVQSLST